MVTDFLLTYSISRVFFQFPWLSLGEHNCLKNAERLLPGVTMKKYRNPDASDNTGFRNGNSFISD